MNDCKSSRVVIYAEIYPARIRRKIVNAIGRNLTEFRDLEIVNPHRLRPSLRPQLASAILEVADQLFFLGVDGDRWLARALEVFDRPSAVPQRLSSANVSAVNFRSGTRARRGNWDRR
jgi:hypothetical protein